MKHAVAYFRTSSAANVGENKDSLARQERAVTEYARKNSIEIVGEYYDAAVTGAEPLDEREGFTLLLQRIASNGVRTILVETANRFARDLIVQEIGFRRLQDLGVDLIAVDSPQAFLEDTPTAVMIRQILGAVAQFDKAQTVAKLRAARMQAKARTGKCEGRKSHAEKNPGLAERARELRNQGATLAAIATALAAEGHTANTGQPLACTIIARMVAGE